MPHEGWAVQTQGRTYREKKLSRVSFGSSFPRINFVCPEWFLGIPSQKPGGAPCDTQGLHPEGKIGFHRSPRDIRGYIFSLLP